MHPQACIQYEGDLPVAWTCSGISPRTSELHWLH
jgi:hypothetical protein